MQSGLVTSESLAQVLRGISQKRQQGVLEITNGDEKVSVLFYSGKIVDFKRSNVERVPSFYAQLRRYGLVGEYQVKDGQDYSSLYRELVNNDPPLSHLSESLFKCLVKHSVLRGLFSLDLASQAFYSFRAEVIEYDKAFCPNISVGQFLLDLVALESDGERFNSVFTGNPFVKVSASFVEPSSEEEEIVELMINRGLTLKEVLANELLSQYYLKETLLSMYEQGDLELEGIDSPEAGVQNLSHLADSLDDSIDKSFFQESSDQEPEVLNRKASAKSLRAAKKIKEASNVIDAASTKPARLSIYWLNARILRNPLIPQLVALLIIACGVLAPIFLWANVWAGFR